MWLASVLLLQVDAVDEADELPYTRAIAARILLAGIYSKRSAFSR